MKILNIIKQITNPGILVKHFNGFVPSGTLNIKQIFLTILKDKELWKTQLQKIKIGELYPQLLLP